MNDKVFIKGKQKVYIKRRINKILMEKKTLKYLIIGSSLACIGLGLIYVFTRPKERMFLFSGTPPYTDSNPPSIREIHTLPVSCSETDFVLLTDDKTINKFIEGKITNEELIQNVELKICKDNVFVLPVYDSKEDEILLKSMSMIYLSDVIGKVSTGGMSPVGCKTCGLITMMNNVGKSGLITTKKRRTLSNTLSVSHFFSASPLLFNTILAFLMPGQTIYHKATLREVVNAIRGKFPGIVPHCTEGSVIILETDEEGNPSKYTECENGVWVMYPEPTWADIGEAGGIVPLGSYYEFPQYEIEILDIYTLMGKLGRRGGKWLGLDPEKYAGKRNPVDHCIASCQMARKRSAGISMEVGIGKEFIYDPITGGHTETSDILADEKGIQCAKGSLSCETCCENDIEVTPGPDGSVTGPAGREYYWGRPGGRII